MDRNPARASVIQLLLAASLRAPQTETRRYLNGVALAGLALTGR
jgi:hypothetical protein